MSDAQPTPNFEPAHPEKFQDELECMQFLHMVYEQSLEMDQADQERRLSILDKTVMFDASPFLQFCAAEDIDPPMHCDYYQIAFQIPRSSTARPFASDFVARFPAINDDEQLFDMPAGVTHWNDVSLEVKFGGNLVQRFWLNGKGLAPYNSADDIQLLFDRDRDEADLFAAPELDASQIVHSLSGPQLGMLLRACDVKRQSNNPEDDQ